MNESVEVCVHWLVRDGVRQFVCHDAAAAQGRRERKLREEPDAGARWTIEAELLRLPQATVTQLFDVPTDSAHHWHAVWPCPRCGREHVTDIDSPAPSREVWWCERGIGLVLVVWTEAPQ